MQTDGRTDRRTPVEVWKRVSWDIFSQRFVVMLLLLLLLVERWQPSMCVLPAFRCWCCCWLGTVAHRCSVVVVVGIALTGYLRRLLSQKPWEMYTSPSSEAIDQPSGWLAVVVVIPVRMCMPLMMMMAMGSECSFFLTVCHRAIGTNQPPLPTLLLLLSHATSAHGYVSVSLASKWASAALCECVCDLGLWVFFWSTQVVI